MARTPHGTLHGALLVARREFLERGRSRVFLGVMIGMAALILGGMFAVNRLGTSLGSATVAVAGDHDPSLPAALAQVADSLGTSVTVVELPTPTLAREAVLAGDADAALIDGRTVLAVGSPGPALDAVLRGGAAASARIAVAGQLGLGPEQLARVLDPVTVTVVDINPEGPADAASQARGVAAFISVLILFMTLMVFGQFVGMGVVEEKQNRVAELVLAKVSTAAMLVGKVLGIGALGLLQLVVLGVATLVGLRLFPPEVVGLDVGQLGLLAIGWMVAWFVLGYLMYSFLYATMGATVSRLEDLQSLAYLPALVLIPAYVVAAAGIGGSPSPWLAPMSLVPWWAPLLMPYRIVTGDAVAWEVMVAIVGSVAFIVLLVWVGARVYRGAALRTGGRVRFREAWRAG